MKRLSVKVSAPRIWYLCSCSFYHVWAFMPVDIIGRYFSSLLAAHYGMAVIPARPYKPQDKAKVEVGVQIVERWILAA